MVITLKSSNIKPRQIGSAWFVASTILESYYNNLFKSEIKTNNMNIEDLAKELQRVSREIHEKTCNGEANIGFMSPHVYKVLYPTEYKNRSLAFRLKHRRKNINWYPVTDPIKRKIYDSLNTVEFLTVTPL